MADPVGRRAGGLEFVGAMSDLGCQVVLLVTFASTDHVLLFHRTVLRRTVHGLQVEARLPPAIVTKIDTFVDLQVAGFGLYRFGGALRRPLLVVRMTIGPRLRQARGPFPCPGTRALPMLHLH
ncbi:MAG: hypothetical protein ABI586_06280 [Candidatus Nanopelagicales bacterium]